jgi:subtilase family serine protease
MRTLRLFLLCILATQLMYATQSPAEQFVAPRVRIVNRIDESDRITLKGNTHPAARAANDKGPVSPTLAMTDLILVLSRDPVQQGAFDKFVGNLYNPDSPDFHQWLTPRQVGADFGPSETDVATITNWLTGHGFTVSEVSNDRLSIRFNGTAALVESAFHTEIHNLSVHGVAHIANMSDPEIPAALASVVVGVKALHNFFPRPEHHLGSAVERDSATGMWKRLSAPILRLRRSPVR